MISWETLWKVLLIGGIALFAGMSVWVTIFGARDIKQLLRTIRDQHEHEEEGR